MALKAVVAFDEDGNKIGVIPIASGSQRRNKDYADLHTRRQAKKELKALADKKGIERITYDIVKLDPQPHTQQTQDSTSG